MSLPPLLPTPPPPPALSTCQSPCVFLLPSAAGSGPPLSLSRSMSSSHAHSPSFSRLIVSPSSPVPPPRRPASVYRILTTHSLSVRAGTCFPFRCLCVLFLFPVGLAGRWFSISGERHGQSAISRQRGVHCQPWRFCRGRFFSGGVVTSSDGAFPSCSNGIWMRL